MICRFRTALMWLLLVALPLQGFAAATMLHCGPNHHRLLGAAAAPANEAHHHAAGGHHRHATVGTDGHHGTVGDDSAKDLSSVQHLDNLAKFKCSACAACCMGAALPTAAHAMACVPPAMTTAVFVPTPHVDFWSDGLDRPPRSFLA